MRSHEALVRLDDITTAHGLEWVVHVSTTPGWLIAQLESDLTHAKLPPDLMSTPLPLGSSGWVVHGSATRDWPIAQSESALVATTF